MNNVLRHFYLILVFILADAFIRSILPAFRIADSAGNGVFWGSLGFYMLYFMAFQSWFYFPVAVAFYVVSDFMKFNRLVFIATGALLAYSHYLFYCFNNGDSVGNGKFYIRSVQYVLFGGFFAAFRYRSMLPQTGKSTEA